MFLLGSLPEGFFMAPEDVLREQTGIVEGFAYQVLFQHTVARLSHLIRQAEEIVGELLVEERHS